jgi:acetyl esterase/lipase
MFNTNVTMFKSINQLFVITVSDPDPHLVPSRFGRYKVVDEIILSISQQKDDLSFCATLQASIGQLKGLPPAVFINGENDVLHDEGKGYALKLSEAGVPVTAVRYPTIHDFVMLNPITDDPSPRAAIEQASIMLKNALSH